MTMLLYIIGIMIIIFVHEIGHYMAAKMVGFTIEEFSMGFGSKLISKKYKDKIFSLRMIPLGGYVTINEFNTDYVIPREQVRMFSLKKIAVCLAGPLFNFLLAIFIFLFTGNIMGLQIDHMTNQQFISQNVNIGDYLRSINGQRIFKQKDMQLFLKTDDINILTIENTKSERYYILYQADTNKLNNVEFKKQTVFTRIDSTMQITKIMIKTFVEAYADLFNGKSSIVQEAENPYKYLKDTRSSKSSFGYTFNKFMLITAVFSWSVFMFNLLPIVIFDGFKVIMNFFSLLTGKSLGEKWFYFLNAIGIIVTLLLFL